MFHGKRKQNRDSGGNVVYCTSQILGDRRLCIWQGHMEKHQSREVGEKESEGEGLDQKLIRGFCGKGKARQSDQLGLAGFSISSGCFGLQGRSLTSWHLTLEGLRQKDLLGCQSTEKVWGARARESGCCGFCQFAYQLHLVGPLLATILVCLWRGSLFLARVFFFKKSKHHNIQKIKYGLHQWLSR